MLKGILHSVLFLVGLFGAAASICSLDVVPYWSWARYKVVHVDRELDRYDTLFFGSSRMHYALMPSVFDVRMGELGKPTRSFNFALSGMRPHDFAGFVDRVLAKKPRHLRRMVIELHSFALNVRGGDWMADMEIEMRSSGQFWSRCESIVRSPFGLALRVEQLGHHVVHTLINVLRIGQGVRILRDQVASRQGQQVPGACRVEDAGYACVEDSKLPHMIAVHEKFVCEPERAAETLAAKAREIAPGWLMGGFRLDLVRDQAARIRAAGIEPIYVVMPTFAWDFVGREGVFELAKEVPVLELDVVDENRPLFALELWFDGSHLNRKGAEFFSRYLAEKVLGAKVRPPAPASQLAPVVMPPQLTARWVDAGMRAVEFDATTLPVAGEVTVVVSLQQADEDLGGGIRRLVALPLVAAVQLTRAGDGKAHARLDLGGMATDAPLYCQLCVLERGVVRQASASVKLEGKR